VMGEKCPFCESVVDDCLELHTCRGTMVWEQRRELVPKGTADYLRGRIATLTESCAAKDARIAELREAVEWALSHTYPLGERPSHDKWFRDELRRRAKEGV
jgi:hypothetical protein